MTVKHFFIPVLLLLSISCSENNSGTSQNNSNTNNPGKGIPADRGTDTYKRVEIEQDTALLSISEIVLKQLKNKNYSGLSNFIPQQGIRFSPFGVADTIKNKQLTAKRILEISKTKKIINWGIYQGTGEPINLNIDDYFNRFVYDVDFLNAEKKSLNKIAGSDSLSGNIKIAYPGCYFIQFYFSGFKARYAGMDWKSLVLVFKKENTKTFLISIIHDEWKG